MDKYILVEGDQNDGDYVSEFSIISDKDLEKIKPLIKQIKMNKGKYDDPYATYEEIDNDVLDTFNSFYVPKNIHTIVNIILYNVSYSKSLL